MVSMAEQSAGEQKHRVRDEINPAIYGLLKTRSPPLELSDFDVRVRQTLHAIHGKGGQEQVERALGMVSAFAAKKPRNTVQSWPAYVGAILRRFLDEFEVQFRSGETQDTECRLTSWNFKSPTAAHAPVVNVPELSDAKPKMRKAKAWGKDHTWDQHAAGNAATCAIKDMLKGNAATCAIKDMLKIPTWQPSASNAQRWADMNDGYDWDWNGWASAKTPSKQTQKWTQSDKLLSTQPYSRTSQAQWSTPEKTELLRSRSSADIMAEGERKPWTSVTSSMRPRRGSYAYTEAAEEVERKPRTSLTGKVEGRKSISRRKSMTWEPKAPTLASMLQPTLTFKHVEKELISWAKIDGHAAGHSKLIAVRDADESGGRIAALMLGGSEFLVELRAPEGCGKYVVVDAQTRSAWPALKDSIAAALESASKKVFVKFIDALWLALPASVRGDQDTQQGALADHAAADANIAEKSAQDAGVREAPAEGVSGVAEEGTMCTVGMEKAQELPKNSRARNFCRWLNNREPFWRFDQKGAILWEFPLAKSEKKEFLRTNLDAENAQLREENADLKFEGGELLQEIEYCQTLLEQAHAEKERLQAELDDLQAKHDETGKKSQDDAAASAPAPAEAVAEKTWPAPTSAWPVATAQVAKKRGGQRRKR